MRRPSRFRFVVLNAGRILTETSSTEAAKPHVALFSCTTSSDANMSMFFFRFRFFQSRKLCKGTTNFRNDKIFCAKTDFFALTLSPCLSRRRKSALSPKAGAKLQLSFHPGKRERGKFKGVGVEIWLNLVSSARRLRFYCCSPGG